MRAMLRSLAVCALFAALACSKRSPAPATGSHAESPQHPCTWFTAAEIAARVGANVSDGQVDGPLGTSCQWKGADGVSVQLQIVRDASFWSLPAAAPGYAALPGIGKAAYAVDQDGGVKASALLEQGFVTVIVAGVADARAAAQRLLVDAVPRVR